jgi:hypothetical protein
MLKIKDNQQIGKILFPAGSASAFRLPSLRAGEIQEGFDLLIINIRASLQMPDTCKKKGSGSNCLNPPPPTPPAGGGEFQIRRFDPLAKKEMYADEKKMES